MQGRAYRWWAPDGIVHLSVCAFVLAVVDLTRCCPDCDQLICGFQLYNSYFEVGVEVNMKQMRSPIMAAKVSSLYIVPHQDARYKSRLHSRSEDRADPKPAQDQAWLPFLPISHSRYRASA